MHPRLTAFLPEKALHTPLLIIGSYSLYNLLWGPADAFFALYLKQFTSSLALIGLFSSLLSLAPIFLGIVVAMLMQRLEPKKLLIYGVAGAAFYALLYFAAGISGLTSLLITTLVIHGICSTARGTGFDAALRTSVPQKDIAKVYRWSSLSDAAWGLGMLLGAVLITFFEINLLYLVPAVGALITAAALSRIHSKPTISAAAKSHPTSFRATILYLRRLSPLAFIMLLVSLLCSMGFSVMDSFTALYLDSLHASLSFIACVTGGVYLSLLLVPLLSRFVRHMDPFFGMLIGFSLLIATLLSLYAVGGSVLAAIPVFIALHHALFYLFVRSFRNALLAAQTDSQHQGSLTALQTAAFAIGSVISGVGVGAIADNLGISAAYLLVACVYALAAALIVYAAIRYSHTLTAIQRGFVARVHHIHLHRFGEHLKQDLIHLIHDIERDAARMAAHAKKDL